MTIAWMLCFLIVGALLLAVAFGADLIAAWLRWPRRAVWSVVMLGMCVLPLALRFITPPVSMFIYSGKPQRADVIPAATAAPIASPVREAAAPAVTIFVPRTTARGNRAVVTPDSPFIPLDRWALLVWTVTAVAYAGMVMGAYRRMLRARQQWTAAPASITHTVTALAAQPTRVWCSDDVGPAAFGVTRPAVVIPRWALELEPTTFDLLLRHEASHIRARDPLLLRLALASVIAMPWNVPLLIAYRRLHRAVEHDCDARVITGTHDARGYGRLLIETASRFAGRGAADSWTRATSWLPAPVPGIGTRRSELEARLRALVPPVSTWRSRVRLLSAAAVMITGVLVACAVPSPERTGSESRAMLSRPDRRPFGGVSSARPKYMDEAFVMSALDSVVIMDAALSQFQRMMRRGRILQDSIVEASARAAVPQAFQSADSVVDLFVLLDDTYRVERYAIGPQYYSVRRDAFDGDTVARPATRNTPRNRHSLNTNDYLRAFPGLTREEMQGIGGIVDVRRGARSVQIMWVRRVAVDTSHSVGRSAPASSDAERKDSITLADMIGVSERSKNATGSVRQSYRASFDTLLRMRIAAVEPRALRPTSTDDPFVWILLDQKADVLAHGIGREGMAARRNGRYDPSDAALATHTTPIEDLVLGCDAFRRKFADVAAAGDVSNCGWSATTVGARRLNISWAVSGRFP